jgi:tetratricopeptide (TPR) repeat protein
MDSSERGLSLYNEGRRLLDSGQRAAGITALLEAIHAAPHFKTYEVLGEALLADGRHQEACVYLSASVGLARSQPKARYLLAKALLALGDDYTLDAAVQLTEAIRINKDFRSAKELLTRIVAENPSLADELKELCP